VTWRHKKQNVVARFSAEAEYRAMTHTTCELICIQSLFSEMGVIYNKPMVMYCDNWATMYITNNLVFYERTKHIKVKCHFIRDMVMTHRIVTSSVTSSCQLGDIFTKALSRKSFSILYSKLGMIDTYAPAWGRILE